MSDRTDVPVLLTSLASAAVMDGRGDLELVRETRGAPVDWGGVYGQLVRLTGPWRLGLETGPAGVSLPGTIVASHVGARRWTGVHRAGSLEIVQEVAAIDRPAGVVRTLRLSHSGAGPVRATVTSSFAPYLLPVLVEGVRPRAFRVETAADQLVVRQRGFGLAFRSTVLPSRLFLNDASWRGGRWEGDARTVGSEHEVVVEPGRPTTVRFLLSGGLERDLTAAARDVPSPLEDPDASVGRLERADDAWLAATPRLRFPDAPFLERAYDAARRALRRLYTEPGDGLTGLVAGYPWYSAIWCRDLAWMLPAVLWLGDLDWCERSIGSVLRYQARSALPLLGGEAGELPMQIAPGPVFLYGTSDTSLYYPDLAARYLRHGGRPAAADAWWPAIERVVRWGLARTDPATGLLRNGGEAEGMSAATGTVARVRYGIDAPDTTIWDSTDRRDHAIDVQVLWHAALRAAAALGTGRVGTSELSSWSAASERVARTVAGEYLWPDEAYLFDSLGRSGPIRKVRPNALRAVAAGLLAPSIARAAVARAARDDLSAEWGVRTLSSRDPGYDPRAYHDGEVWTIATAWAADAALAVGDGDLGLRYLATIARRYEEEGGLANECYRGDVAEPFDSCFLLGFSVAPFLTVLFERLWGLAMDARIPSLAVVPTFPIGWTSAELTGLRLGDGSVDLAYRTGTVEVRWHGSRPLELAAGNERTTVPPGAATTVTVGGPGGRARPAGQAS